MREAFFDELYKQMQKDEDIYFLTGDLGYGKADAIMKDFPDRAINCGASEQAMLGIAVGLGIEGRIPFVYSITPFVLYRPFETIRNYLDHEGINVKLIGSGRDKDYKIDGYSHHSEEAWKLFNVDAFSGHNAIFQNIIAHFPIRPIDAKRCVSEMVERKKPEFLSLRK